MDSDRILGLLDEPEALEALYRESPKAFRTGLQAALQARPDAVVLRVWAARLSFRDRAARGVLGLGAVIVLALTAGLLVRLPAIGLTEDWYYPRFAPSLVLLALATYFWFERRDRKQLIAGVSLAAVAGVYTSLLPGFGDSVAMALLHLPILWWMFLGFVFTGPGWRDTEARIRYLRYNGELLILGSLVALGAMVFSGLTVALFSMALGSIEEPYFENVGVMLAAAMPVVATYLYDAVFRRHTGIASVLARVFAPLFLVMTGSYLVVALVGGQNPFLDRSVLITVNGLLLVVLGMTVLSIAERGEDGAVGGGDYINVALLAVTLLTDLAALSAIVFRLASYGFTPNRVVVLGANVVVLVHLAAIGASYLGFVRGRAGVEGIRRASTAYLPAYAAWAAIVCFVLPFVFGFS